MSKTMKKSKPTFALVGNSLCNKATVRANEQKWPNVSLSLRNLAKVAPNLAKLRSLWQSCP